MVGVDVWTIEELERHAATLTDAAELERLRLLAQTHAHRRDEPEDVRRRWATLSLSAGARIPGDGPWQRTGQRAQSFALRTWVIDRLGPAEDPD